LKLKNKALLENEQLKAKKEETDRFNKYLKDQVKAEEKLIDMLTQKLGSS